MSSSRIPCTYEKQVYLIMSPLYWAMVVNICLLLLLLYICLVLFSARFHIDLHVIFLCVITSLFTGNDVGSGCVSA